MPIDNILQGQVFTVLRHHDPLHYRTKRGNYFPIAYREEARKIAEEIIGKPPLINSIKEVLGEVFYRRKEYVPTHEQTRKTYNIVAQEISLFLQRN